MTVTLELLTLVAVAWGSGVIAYGFGQYMERHAQSDAVRAAQREFEFDAEQSEILMSMTRLEEKLDRLIEGQNGQSIRAERMSSTGLHEAGPQR